MRKTGSVVVTVTLRVERSSSVGEPVTACASGLFFAVCLRTCRVSVAVRVIEPLTPLTSTENVPVGVEEVVPTVSDVVVEKDVSSKLEVKLVVDALGAPVTLTATTPTNPFDGATLMEYVTEPPRVTD